MGRNAESHIFARNVCDSFMKSWEYFHTGSISFNLCFIGFLMIYSGSRLKWGLGRNVQKCYTASDVLASCYARRGYNVLPAFRGPGQR